MSYRFLGIDHVQLAAPRNSEEQARKFYGEILQMTEIPKPTKLLARGGVWFQCGNHQVHIGIQEEFHPATKAHPAFEVQHLHLFAEHLRANGVEVKEDDALDGAERFYVNDPFGNRIEFLEWKH